MTIRQVKESEKNAYNKTVGHIIQSWEWGEFRKKTGIDVVRLGEFDGKNLKQGFQLTLHPVPFFKQYVGYLPKGPMPTHHMLKALREFGLENNVAFIKLEPNVILDKKKDFKSLKKDGLVPAKKSLFTKYNFVLDLKKSEEELLAGMHPKTRYNIKVAQKRGVEVYESTKDIDFDIYLDLYFETTRRQRYFGHTPKYHRLVWDELKNADMARLLIAKYQGVPLVAWMLFNFGKTLYYPYGGSSTLHREVMASNLVAWEAIKVGKRLGMETFDMWGALGPNADPNDPWHGFHRFKQGYGPKHVEYVGSYDLVLKKASFQMFNVADRARWAFLKAFKTK